MPSLTEVRFAHPAFSCKLEVTTNRFYSLNLSCLDITPVLEEYLHFILSCTLNSIFTFKAMLLVRIQSSANTIMIVSPFKYVAKTGNRHYRLGRGFLILNDPKLHVQPVHYP